MDTPFEQPGHISEAEMENFQNYYQKVQEHFHALQAYHHRLQNLYRTLHEHNFSVQVLYHQVRESFDHTKQVPDHVLRAYQQAVREQREMSIAYHDALQEQNLQEQP